MIPDYVQRVAPGIAVEGNAGLPAAAKAGMGRAVAGVGAAVEGWGQRKIARSDALAYFRARQQFDGQRLTYLRELPKRREDLAATSVDIESGQSRTGYERELDAYPKWLDEQYARLADGLSRDARMEFEGYYRQHAAGWAEQGVQALETLELEDISGEILQAAGEDRVSDAKDLFDLYADRFSPGDRARIAAAVETAALEARRKAVQGDLQEIARTSGWETAERVLSDPEYQKTWGLDIDESGQLKSELAKFARDVRERSDRQAAYEQDQLERKRLDEAYQGKTDLVTVRDEFVAGQISKATYDEIRKLAVKGPPTEDDPEAYMEAETWRSRVRAKPGRKEAALAWLRQNSAKFTPGTWKQYVRDYETAGDPSDPMGSPTAKLLDGLIDEKLYTNAKGEYQFGEVRGDEAEAAFIRTKQAWRKWVTDHPEATDEELNQRYQEFFAPIDKPGRLRRLLDWIAAANAPAPAVSWEGQNRYRLSPIDVEPQTREQFEQQFMALPYGSEEQTAYYEKWAGKWR